MSTKASASVQHCLATTRSKELSKQHNNSVLLNGNKGMMMRVHNCKRLRRCCFWLSLIWFQLSNSAARELKGDNHQGQQQISNDERRLKGGKDDKGGPKSAKGAFDLVGGPSTDDGAFQSNNQGGGFGQSVSDTGNCRCEFPQEGLYSNGRQLRVRHPPHSVSSRQTYVIVNGVTVFPSDYFACRGVVYVCQGDFFYGPLWNYDCSSTGRGDPFRGSVVIVPSEYPLCACPAVTPSDTSSSSNGRNKNPLVGTGGNFHFGTSKTQHGFGFNVFNFKASKKGKKRARRRMAAVPRGDVEVMKNPRIEFVFQPRKGGKGKSAKGKGKGKDNKGKADKKGKSKKGITTFNPTLAPFRCPPTFPPVTPTRRPRTPAPTPFETTFMPTISPIPTIVPVIKTGFPSTIPSNPPTLQVVSPSPSISQMPSFFPTGAATTFIPTITPIPTTTPGSTNVTKRPTSRPNRTRRPTTRPTKARPTKAPSRRTSAPTRTNATLAPTTTFTPTSPNTTIPPTLNPTITAVPTISIAPSVRNGTIAPSTSFSPTIRNGTTAPSTSFSPTIRNGTSAPSTSFSPTIRNGTSAPSTSFSPTIRNGTTAPSTSFSPTIRNGTSAPSTSFSPTIRNGTTAPSTSFSPTIRNGTIAPSTSFSPTIRNGTIAPSTSFSPTIRNGTIAPSTSFSPTIRNGTIAPSTSFSPTIRNATFVPTVFNVTTGPSSANPNTIIPSTITPGTVVPTPTAPSDIPSLSPSSSVPSGIVGDGTTLPTVQIEAFPTSQPTSGVISATLVPTDSPSLLPFCKGPTLGGDSEDTAYMPTVHPTPVLSPTQPEVVGVTCRARIPTSSPTLYPSLSSPDMNQAILCIAIVDDAGEATAESLNQTWATFRARYPSRPFCLLQPSPNVQPDLKIPAAFTADLKTTYSDINRDYGAGALASSWFRLCRLEGLRSQGINKVAVYIDEWDQITARQVRASYQFFLLDITAQGISLLRANEASDDNWVLPFLRDFQ